MSTYEINYVGLLAELAWGKKFNYYVEFTISARKGGSDFIDRFGRKIDVKGTRNVSGDMNVTSGKKKHPDDLYFSGIVREIGSGKDKTADVEFVGFSLKDDVFLDKYITQGTNGPYYKIPRGDLLLMGEYLKMNWE